MMILKMWMKLFLFENCEYWHKAKETVYILLMKFKQVFPVNTSVIKILSVEVTESLLLIFIVSFHSYDIYLHKFH